MSGNVSAGVELTAARNEIDAASSITPGSLRAWVLAARPKTLTAAVSPVLVGSACALSLGAFRPGPAFAALIGAILLQIGANFANDVFDYEKGADTQERLGPLRAVQAGLLTPKSVRAAMVWVFALSLAVGIYLTVSAGLAVVAIGISSIIAAIAYTGGPYPLGYNGLGDLFVMIFFGFVAVCGTVLVQVGAIPALGFLAAIPVGCLATGILVVNNLRDRTTDARAGKRTLAVRFGRRFVLSEYAALMLAAYATPVLIRLLGLSGTLVLLPLASAPLGARLVRQVRREEGRALNASLVSTAKLVFIFSALFALGLSLDAML